MHGKQRVLLTGIVVLIAAGAFVLRYRAHVDRPWTRDGQVRAQVVQVAPRVTAPIVDLPIEDNQFVRTGDLLFGIDRSDFQLAVDKAEVQLDQAREDVASLEAAVRAAQAQVNEARAGVTSAEGQIESSRATLESAQADVQASEAGVSSARAGIAERQADVEEAKREAERAQRLADQKAGSVETAQSKAAALAASQAQLDSAEAGLKEAQANLTKAHAGVTQGEASLVISQNGLSEANAKLETALANLDQARANLGKPGDANVRVRQAKVELQQAELQLSWTSVYAPVDGYVTNLSLQLGDQAIANQPALALVDTNSFWIDAYFKENQLEGMAMGDQAVVTLMSYPKQPIAGRIQSIGWGISQDDGSTGADLLPSVSPTFEWIRLAQRIPVQIGRLELPDGVDLRVGTTASVQVKKGTAAGANAAPAIEE